MNYEDENNLYHYSYRKGDKVENVRDVDYNEETTTAAKADTWVEKQPKKKFELVQELKKIKKQET